MSHQQTDKHGPAIDEALKDPRRQASAGTRHADRPEDNPTGGPAPDDIALRSELARFLAPAAFPGDSDTLRSVAVDNNATDEILLLLDDLPEGRQFETVEEVWEAVH